MKCAIPYERRAAMLIYFSSGKLITIAELKKEFGISRNTVLRDIDAISHHPNYKIAVKHGRHGGYKLVMGKELDKNLPNYDDYLALMWAADNAPEEFRGSYLKLIRIHWKVEMW